jgi:hypothetical protein
MHDSCVVLLCLAVVGRGWSWGAGNGAGPVRGRRGAAQQAPAAILAGGLGAQRGTAARHAKLAGADYASYPSAAGRNIARTAESP